MSEVNEKRKGKYKHKCYRRWTGMKERCHDKNHPQYKDYGGRGIQVCDEWCNDFWSYADYMDSLEADEDATTVDRINNDGNYEPGNVRWASRSTQGANRRSYGRGYSFNKTNQRWKVQWQIEGKVIYFGYYDTEAEARTQARLTCPQGSDNYRGL